MLSCEVALTEYMKDAALKFGQENTVAHVGDIVMSDFGDKGILRTTRIVSVSVYLISVWNGIYTEKTGKFDDPQWTVEFEMDYAGQRLKKDGSVLGGPSNSSCLSNFTKTDGTTWTSRRNNREVTWFNHCALSWDIENSYNHERREYVCLVPGGAA